jgi:hypothetical protein
MLLAAAWMAISLALGGTVVNVSLADQPAPADGAARR